MTLFFQTFDQPLNSERAGGELIELFGDIRTATVKAEGGQQFNFKLRAQWLVLELCKIDGAPYQGWKIEGDTGQLCGQGLTNAAPACVEENDDELVRGCRKEKVF